MILVYVEALLEILIASKYQHGLSSLKFCIRRGCRPQLSSALDGHYVQVESLSYIQLSYRLSYPGIRYGYFHQGVISVKLKIIKQITEETGAKIDIEDSGLVYIASVDAAGGEKAKEWIETLTKDVEVGETYVGKVTRIMNFGAFVEVLPGKEGLVHISQLAKERVEKVEDVVHIGDEIMVKCVEIDSQGRVNLSRKALLGGGSPAPSHRGGGRRGPRDKK